MTEFRDEHTRVFHLDARHCAAAYRHVLLLCYARRPSADFLRLRLGWFRELQQAYGQGLGIISVIRGTTGLLPSEDSRAETKKQMTEFGVHVRFIATVIETPGIQGMAVRSMLRGISVLARRKFPFEFFSSSDEAIAFAARHMEADLKSHTMASLHRLNLERAIAMLKEEQDRLLIEAGRP